MLFMIEALFYLDFKYHYIYKKFAIFALKISFKINLFCLNFQSILLYEYGNWFMRAELL